MDNKTKLFVTDLSAVSLSTDYLYAKDSNIKTDVKVDPVDNDGEKIATITVNGVPTEISTKTNCAAIEIFPTNVDIPAGTPDTLDAMKSLMPDIKEEGFNESGMTYIEAVPAQMKLTFNMCSNHEKSKSDMIIDFGDGTVISTKDYTSDTEANPKLEVVKKSDYGRWDYKIEYTYSKPGKYIVTTRGKNYYTIR